MKTCATCIHWQGGATDYAAGCAKGVLVRPTFDQDAERCEGWEDERDTPPSGAPLRLPGPPEYRKGVRCW